MQLDINGTAAQVDAADDTPLLWVLRDHLGLTGTKFGCGMALCGACTVHIEGQAVDPASRRFPRSRARRSPRSKASAPPKIGKAVQDAWLAIDVPQCGYCQTGQIMSATALLEQQREADRRGHRLLDERQHLSLRHLSAHPRRYQAGGGRGGRQVMNAQLTESLSVAAVSRREFLVRASALGGLVLLATSSAP